MRNIIIALTIIMLACVSCKNETNRLQNGDLLFVGLPLNYALDTTDMASAIIESTGDTTAINYIHVAIVELDKKGDAWIIDATIKHGVDRYPLDTFLCDFTLNDGSYPTFDILRVDGISEDDAKRYVENAKNYIGCGYDMCFLPDNTEQYCSELVRNAYKHGENYIFNEYPMNFKSDDGTFPKYWQDIFALLQQPIPQDIPGTNPNGMIKEECLKKVYCNILDFKNQK